MADTNNPRAESEKLAVQAETGGRTAARPGGASGISSGLQPGSTSPSNAPLRGDMGSIGAPGGSTGGAGSLSGQVTNDSMPEGGATGDKAQPDTVPPAAGDLAHPAARPLILGLRMVISVAREGLERRRGRLHLGRRHRGRNSRHRPSQKSERSAAGLAVALPAC